MIKLRHQIPLVAGTLANFAYREELVSQLVERGVANAASQQGVGTRQYMQDFRCRVLVLIPYLNFSTKKPGKGGHRLVYFILPQAI
jgi:hypothetical protein